MWTKPAASLARPGEAIPINDFCARSLLDYEVNEHSCRRWRKWPPNRWTFNVLTWLRFVGGQGELVFITSKEAKNVPISEAKDYILGYTIGNDLSCRMYQVDRYSAGQFFFAKAFDKFAPIGPTLISPEIFGNGSSFTVVTKVNGEVRQTAEFTKDLIFSPERILSHMSQGRLNICSNHPNPGRMAKRPDFCILPRHHNTCRYSCVNRNASRCRRLPPAKELSSGRRCGGSRDEESWHTPE